MKQKSLGIFAIAMVAVLFAGLVSAADAKWVTDDNQTIEIHAHADAMFFDEGGESFDLAELRDGETRTFGVGDKQVTVARTGDVVTIARDESDDGRVLEFQCDTGKDNCQVITFADNPEKVMIMIQKTRECINGVGDCGDLDIAIGDIGEARHAIIRTMKCGDAGSCQNFEKIIGGGPHHKMMFIHADEQGDQVLLGCPEGDSKIHVTQEEAEDTFLCPKHSVPMVKQEMHHFIQKIQFDRP